MHLYIPLLLYLIIEAMLAKTDAKIIPQTVCDNKKRKKSYFPTVFLTQIKLIDLYQTAKNKKRGFGICTSKVFI